MNSLYFHQKKKEIKFLVNLISKSFKLPDSVKVHFSSALKHSTNLEAMKYPKKKGTISPTNRPVCVIAPTAKCICKCSTLNSKAKIKHNRNENGETTTDPYTRLYNLNVYAYSL